MFGEPSGANGADSFLIKGLGDENFPAIHALGEALVVLSTAFGADAKGWGLFLSIVASVHEIDLGNTFDQIGIGEIGFLLQEAPDSFGDHLEAVNPALKFAEVGLAG